MGKRVGTKRSDRRWLGDDGRVYASTSVPGYSVTNDGRVYSHKTDKFLRPGLAGNGYLTVSLHNNDGGKTHCVHALVALAFVEGHKENKIVNHKDCDKTNNHYTNLEWVTYSDNFTHALVNSKINNKPIISTNLDTGVCVYYPSINKTAKDGFYRYNAVRCANKVYGFKSHKGHTWKWADELVNIDQIAAG